jgi:site-specific DNA-methyltransferase (adenine-specific)
MKTATEIPDSLFLRTTHGLLFQDDCLNILPRIKDETINCIFADPPFNLGKNYKNGYDDNKNQSDYFLWCEQWINECIRVLKPGGAFFLYATPELNIKFAGFMGKSLEFRHWIAVSMKGTFKRGNRLYPAHYGLLYYTKGAPAVFNNLRTTIPVCRHCGGEIPDYGGHRNKLNPEGINLTDIWSDTSPNRHKKFKVREGVNELKLMIPERAILIATQPGDIVLDPFGGGGSTFQAAQKNHRNWIGVELYDGEHIETRLKEEFPESILGVNPDFMKNIFADTHKMAI